jgi:hypothetical protein
MRFSASSTYLRSLGNYTGKCEVLCLTKTCGSGGIDPRFLDLGTSWSLEANFIPRLLLPRVKGPLYLLNRQGGPRAGLDDMENSEFLTLQKLQLRPLGPSDRSQSPYGLRCGYEHVGTLSIAVYCSHTIVNTALTLQLQTTRATAAIVFIRIRSCTVVGLTCFGTFRNLHETVRISAEEAFQ